MTEFKHTFLGFFNDEANDSIVEATVTVAMAKDTNDGFWEFIDSVQEYEVSNGNVCSFYIDEDRSWDWTTYDTVGDVVKTMPERFVIDEIVEMHDDNNDASVIDLKNLDDAWSFHYNPHTAPNRG